MVYYALQRILKASARISAPRLRPWTAATPARKMDELGAAPDFARNVAGAADIVKKAARVTPLR